jgi:3D (Asp-Asp-Asp) domain-containing protein
MLPPVEEGDTTPVIRAIVGIGHSLGLLVLLLGCAAGSVAEAETRSLVVTATAYNSVANQTGSQPSLGAWGDKLRPGMKTIAVSRDLIPQGLGHNARVRIEGFEGEYVVMDKMNKRWTQKIDIYMGTDVEAARRWGKRKVRITWEVPE